MQHLHSVHVPGTALSMVALFISVADPEGVPWVPWNPSFEGLPSKILCENVLPIHYTHTGAMYFSFNSGNNARVSTPASRI